MSSSADGLREIAIAVVGLGKMGIMHASMLQALPGARVAALVDLDPALARNVRSMGIDAPVFNDLEQCLKQAQPDGVVVATPQFTHRTLAELCLSHGTPVFSEKPLAHSLDDARAMLAAAQLHSDVPVASGFQMGHNPLFQKASQMLREGAIGEVKSFNASCRLSQVFSPKSGWTFTRDRAGGGVLMNSGCHLIHVLTMLFGRPEQVSARGSGVHNEVEDTLGALLDYANGVWGLMEVTWSVPGYELQSNDVEAIGTAGTLEVNNDRLRLWLAREHGEREAGWTQWRREDVQPRAPFTLSPEYCGDEFYLQMEDFVAAIRDHRRPLIGFDSSIVAQEIIAALYESCRERRPVPLAPATGTEPA